jgi:archaellum component FlaC
MRDSVDMTIDERLDRLTERHEALTQSVELLAIETRELKSAIAQDAENISTLARIAEIHERRITHL